MGRYISCQIGKECKTVWKYIFGSQNSEMYRIYTEAKIGEYHLIRYLEEDNEDKLNYEYVYNDTDIDGDILILDRSDVKKLEQQIQLLKKSDKSDRDRCYIAMLEAICSFINEYPQQNKFILEGEF